MKILIKRSKNEKDLSRDKSFSRGIGNRDYMIEVFQGDNHKKIIAKSDKICNYKIKKY